MPTYNADDTSPPVLVKDPNSTLDYEWDWEPWLSSDTIATSAFTAPSALTVSGESNTTLTTTCKLAGGTAGETYRVTNRITTANGLTVDRSIDLEVRNR